MSGWMNQPRIERRAGVICSNAACSHCDARTNACLLNVTICKDRLIAENKGGQR